MIDEKLIVELRQYILGKTGIHYFGRIKPTPKNLMVSCPFHKGGQETKPSCGIKLQSDDKSSMGTVHCFTCGVTTDIDKMVQQILGILYNENEVEALFGFKTMLAQETFIPVKQKLFAIPKTNHVKESVLREYRYYHPYLESRGISKQTAQKYDIGFDDHNQHITFPIKNIRNQCVGVGRRSILEKKYIYPHGMVKPLYGLYELPKQVRFLWVVEGPFNLWSLDGWEKFGVAMLGTGTSYQYNQLLQVNCDGYVLALDGDSAGYKGTLKLGEFLIANHKKVYVAVVPENEDINSISYEQFRHMPVVTFYEWKRVIGSKLSY